MIVIQHIETGTKREVTIEEANLIFGNEAVAKMYTTVEGNFEKIETQPLTPVNEVGNEFVE